MRSMTGFGRQILECNGRRYIIEIKSVNNKYCDISIKLPRTISFAEEVIKKEIAKKISRGKVEVVINYEEYDAIENKVTINKKVVKEYINQINQIAQELEINNNMDISRILTLPEALTINRKNDEDEIKKELIDCTKKVVEDFIMMRETEGNIIKEDLTKRVDKIESIVEKISAKSAGLIEEYVVKLKKRIKELLNTDVIDKERLAQEVVIYADKSSVEEEITRLKSHIIQIRKIMNNVEDAIGKKLDFIIQEMNRETNTIGSKSASAEITNLVIDMKVEIEDIREQIQNIE